VVAEGHTGVHGAQEARVRCGVRDGAVKRRDDDETKRRVATIRLKRLAFSLDIRRWDVESRQSRFSVKEKFITRLV
jgi:hypothetical protein